MHCSAFSTKTLKQVAHMKMGLLLVNTARLDKITVLGNRRKLFFFYSLLMRVSYYTYETLKCRFVDK